ncbi:hypothetical protein ACJX0J_015858 [Zea mays]
MYLRVYIISGSKVALRTYLLHIFVDAPQKEHDDEMKIDAQQEEKDEQMEAILPCPRSAITTTTTLSSPSDFVPEAYLIRASCIANYFHENSRDTYVFILLQFDERAYAGDGVEGSHHNIQRDNKRDFNLTFGLSVIPKNVHQRCFSAKKQSPFYNALAHIKKSLMIFQAIVFVGVLMENGDTDIDYRNLLGKSFNDDFEETFPAALRLDVTTLGLSCLEKMHLPHFQIDINIVKTLRPKFGIWGVTQETSNLLKILLETFVILIHILQCWRDVAHIHHRLGDEVQGEECTETYQCVVNDCTQKRRTIDIKLYSLSEHLPSLTVATAIRFGASKNIIIISWIWSPIVAQILEFLRAWIITPPWC